MHALFALTFQEHFVRDGGLSPELAFLATVLLHAVLLISVFGFLPLFFIWLERKVAGRIQDRLGPTRVGGKFGWLQTLADGIKLIQKEDLWPAAADSWIFRLAPYIAVVASFAAFMVLPFSDGWVAVALDSGVFMILALMSLEVLGIILAGYSSGSKWALFGAMREAAQMVSYEIPMALCVLVPLVAAGSLNFGEIGAMQSGTVADWLIFHDPFTFLAFFTYFTVATASVKRAPFDLAEAESELVAGFHTEYSGLRWSFFFMAEYASMFAVSGIAVLLFLGGWHTGIGVENLLGWLRGWSPDVGVQGFSLGSYILNVIGAQVFMLKCFVLVFVQIWVRWTLPRLRIDQVMTCCLKYLVPISCVLFLGAVLWPLVLASSLGQTTWLSPLGSKTLSQHTVPAAQPVVSKLATTAETGVDR
ncbi:MAG TPA: NADH-quinone oxidoreductase subunit NuoH [Planctomycetaceae bacterium]|nr:NADH-quinone oxidoreductase subunit NuoH [Planctomycetaceae bacterium]